MKKRILSLVVMIIIAFNVCCINISADDGGIALFSTTYPEIVDIVAGGYHSIAHDRSGDVYVFGSNRYGEIGIGTTSEEGVVYDISIDDSGDATKVSSRGDHILTIGTDGKVYSWGYNNHGQLGIGNWSNQSSAIAVNGLPDNVIDVAAGHQFSLALTEDGYVYAWGHGGYGQIGNGAAIENCVTPVKINSLSDVKYISAGHYHALAIKNDGTVWGWGRNTEGQLGNGTTTNVLTPVQLAVSEVKEVVAGFNNSFFIKNDGTVYACGNNTGGELGDGTQENKTEPVLIEGVSNVVQVSSNSCTVFLQEDGIAYGTGSNKSGQLGFGNKIGRILVPTKIPGEGYTKVSVGGEHTLLYWGTTYNGGEYGGKIYAMGSNEYYQCGQTDLHYEDKFTYPTLLTHIQEIDDRVTWAPVTEQLDSIERELFFVSEDTYISQHGEENDTNFSEEELCSINYTRKENGSDDWGQYTYLKFNTSEIDRNRLFTAKLYLYVDETSDIRSSTRTIGIYDTETFDWTDSELTWNSGVVQYGDNLLGTFNVTGNGSIITDAGWREIDLSEYLREYDSENLSLMLKMTSTTPHPVNIRTNENANLKTIPVIVVDYQLDNISDTINNSTTLTVGNETVSCFEEINDIDCFNVDIAENDMYEISINDSANSITNVYNSDQELIGQFSNENTSHVFDLTTGKYYFEIISNNESFGEQYSIEIAKYIPVDENNNSFDDAYSIYIPCKYSSYINTAGDKDFYKFTVDEAGIYSVTVSGPREIGFIIYDSNKKIIAYSNKYILGAYTADFNCEIEKVYYLEIRPNSNYIGEYNVEVSKVTDESGSGWGNAETIQLDSIGNFSLQQGYYKIIPNSTRAYKFNVSGILYDENLQSMDNINHKDISPVSMSTYEKNYNLQEGKTYYLHLTNDYSNNVNNVKHSITEENMSQAQTIGLGYRYLMNNTDEHNNGNYNVGLYKFVAPKTEYFEFEIFDTDIEYQIFYNEKGTLLENSIVVNHNATNNISCIVKLEEGECIYIKIPVKSNNADITINQLNVINSDNAIITEGTQEVDLTNAFSMYTFIPEKNGVYNIKTTNTNTAALLYHNNELLSTAYSSTNMNGSVYTYDNNFSISEYLYAGNVYNLLIKNQSYNISGTIECTYIGDRITTCGDELRFNPTEWVYTGGHSFDTNCYNFALNTAYKPDTTLIPGLQPGQISNNVYDDDEVNSILNDETIEFEERLQQIKNILVNSCISDATAINNTLLGEEYAVFREVSQDEKVSKGCYKVALVISVIKESENYRFDDYHWYRQGIDGNWSHKPGNALPNNYDDSGNIIHIPMPGIANTNGYNYFLGYFEVKDLSSLNDMIQYPSTQNIEMMNVNNNSYTIEDFEFLCYNISRDEIINNLGVTTKHCGSGVQKDVYELEDGRYVIIQYNSNYENLRTAYLVGESGDVQRLV